MNLDQLKEIAQAANQGRWYWHEDGNMYADPAIEPWEYSTKGTPIIQTDSGVYGPEEPERAHIAAFNPATALALIAVTDAALAAVLEERERCAKILEREIGHAIVNDTRLAPTLDCSEGHPAIRLSFVEAMLSAIRAQPEYMAWKR